MLSAVRSRAPIAARLIACIVGSGLALSACGGGGGSAAVPAPSVHAQSIAGKVVLSIPNATASYRRTPRFISPSAVSVSIVVNSGSAQIADVSATSTACTTVSAGRTCTVPIVAPVGNDAFAIALFDGANASGNRLGLATATLNVTAAGFTVNTVVGGVVATITLTLANAYLPAGSAGTTTLTVVAKDADGNIIVGPYANPITLSSSSAAVTISPAQLTQSGAPVTITYSGAQNSNATITASGGSAVSGATTLSPSSTLSNVQTPSLSPETIVQGPDGAIYFCEIGLIGGSVGGFFVGLQPGHIARLDPRTLAITESVTGRTPDALVFTPDGAVWNVNFNDNTIGRYDHFGGTYSTYPVPPGGGPNGPLPRKMILGPDGNLWFTELSANTVATFAPSSPATITEYTIPTAQSRPGDIASGPDGNVWASETGQVNAVPKVAKVTPAGAFTEYTLPVPGPNTSRFMAFATDGNLYTTQLPVNGPGTAIGALVKTTTGGTSSQLALPPLSSPDGITKGPSGSMYLTDQYWAAIGEVSALGSVTLWPLFSQSQLTTSPSIPDDITSVSDGSLWYTEFPLNQLSTTSFVGHFVLGQGWTVFPQGTITIASTGTLTQQLIGFAESGDSSPFTVTSSNTAVVSVSALPTSSHNFMLTGVSNGSATVTVTDKNGRVVLVPVTVTTSGM